MPLANCAITTTTKTDSTTNQEYLEHALYWNSQIRDAALQNMFQIGQVKMACRTDSPSFQLDAVKVSVTEDTDSIPDPTASRIDIRASLSLQVNKRTFNEANKIDETGLTEQSVTSSTAVVPILGQASVTYTASVWVSFLVNFKYLLSIKSAKMNSMSFYLNFMKTLKSHNCFYW